VAGGEDESKIKLAINFQRKTVLLRIIDEEIFMSNIITKIIIDANCEQVWSTLTNFSEYKNWNPFIQKIEGILKIDEQLNIIIQSPDKKPMVFKPKISQISPNRELRWVGTLLAPWLFSGEHFFILTPHGQNQTELTHGENFSGLLVPLFSLLGGLKSTEQGFHLMNEKLAEICKENKSNN
jgi:hypothetical protein